MYGLSQVSVLTAAAGGFLVDLYDKAFELFRLLLCLMQFPSIASNEPLENVLAYPPPPPDATEDIVARKAAEAAIKWQSVWNVVKECFDALSAITIPIATIFFIIAIYKAVISKPPEEQPKQFFQEALHYVIIIFISVNLFTFLTEITRFSEDVTARICNYTTGEDLAEELLRYDSPAGQDGSFWTKGLDIIKKGIEQVPNPQFKDLAEGNLLDFCEKIFTFLLFFLGGLVTLLVFVSSGFTIVMATIQRIVKPLIMIPFSTIVVGLGACSGEGERMVWHYVKSFLGYCMSGVFIIMAIKMGLSLANLDLFNLEGVVSSTDYFMSALVALFRVNLPIVITTGLVKSADTFMDKIFV